MVVLEDGNQIVLEQQEVVAVLAVLVLVIVVVKV
jgi:hypothetical protein